MTRKGHQVCSSHTSAADLHCPSGTCARLFSLQKLHSFLACNLNSNLFYFLQYVALQTAVQVDEVEICLVKEQQANIIRAAGSVDPCKDNLQVLREQETLAELKPDNFSCGHLVNLMDVTLYGIHIKNN